jgi:thioredoxin-dependent peroxiredoxin
MSQITLQGNPIHTVGQLPKIGSVPPYFELVNETLGVKNLTDYTNQTIVLNIFPSLDTDTCAASVRKFNQIAAQSPDTVVLCISKDLPFAQSRFCTIESLNNVEGLSDFRDGKFGNDYGVTIVDGPMKGLLGRSVVVIQKGKVVYTELVPEITNEPNYAEVLSLLN